MATMKRISIQLPYSETSSPPPTRAVTEKGSSYTATTPSRLFLSATPAGRSGGDETTGPPATPFSRPRSLRLFYYKAPAMTGAKFYLDTGVPSPARQPSPAGPARDCPDRPRSRSVWQSGAREHRLRSMGYHMAELSLHYRAPTALGPGPVRQAPPSPEAEAEAEAEAEGEEEEEQQAEEEEGRSPPPPPSPSEPSPSRDSPQQPEPEELVHQSASNRLLNVVSIDECPIKHRKGRRRVRSAFHRSPQPMATPEREQSEPRSLGAPSPLAEPRNSILDRIERLQDFGRERQSPGGTSKARRQFQRRNQLLREHMNVYVAWRTSERIKERLEAMRGIHSAKSVLTANKEERLKAFSAVLRQKELEIPNGGMQGAEEEEEDEELCSSRQELDELGDTPRGEENKLTKMFEMLQ